MRTYVEKFLLLHYFHLSKLNINFANNELIEVNFAFIMTKLFIHVNIAHCDQFSPPIIVY